MKILADIGGTYARFALASGETYESVKKYKAADFETVEQALALYCRENNIDTKPGLRFALAGASHDGAWRFTNQNEWIIDPAALKKEGWNVEIILNDFEAAVWGLIDLKEADRETLKKGHSDNTLPRALAGPGTGLGLGYLLPLSDGGYHVQRTHGGHMPVAALNDEHWLMIQAVQRLKDDDTAPVFENFVSGPGLYNLYKAFCFIAGKKAQADGPEDMLAKHLDTPEVKEALRLFHEFFGLFAATAVVTGHGYSGLYLTGGVLDRLAEKELFDFERFEEFFVVQGVKSVQDALANTPVFRVTEPFLALKGLMRCGDA